MSLTVSNAEQRSEEWYELRRGIVTASVVGRLLTPTLKVADNETSRRLTTQLAAERITGWTEDTALTSDMWRGIDHEPYAREKYAEHYAPVVDVGFMRRDEDAWSLGYSPDGLVGDDGLIEVKCPRAKAHVATILDGFVPDQHMAQLQAGLLVSGRKWVDFVSFVAGMPLYVKRVEPATHWQEAIRDACIEFKGNAEQIIADYNERVRDLPPTERLNFDIQVA